MLVVRNNKLGTRGYCTICKLIIVLIIMYQAKMDINLLVNRSMQPCDGFHHVCRYFAVDLLRKDSVLTQRLILPCNTSVQIL